MRSQNGELCFDLDDSVDFSLLRCTGALNYHKHPLAITKMEVISFPEGKLRTDLILLPLARV